MAGILLEGEVGIVRGYRTSSPEIFYRIVSRVAVSINRRMRLLSEQLFHKKEGSGQISR